MAFSFRPRAWPTIVALLGLGLTMWACWWQYGRGLEKDRIEAQLAAADDRVLVTLGAQPIAEEAIRYRRIGVRGEFLSEAAVFLDNQVRGTTPGLVVFMPLRLTDSNMHVLVKRGWMAAPVNRAIEPSVRTPAGTVDVAGTALPPNSRFLELSSESQAGRVWQNVTLERMVAATHLDFQPLILEQTSDLDDGLVRNWPRPARGSAKHYGYALQWGAMALTIVVLYVVLNVRRIQPS
ncbi:MAG: SURF1 family protein [Zetaproteobacteria bacterium]|nr:MAG: SURF1 family protein [Zetaproteobacteria bacterium]